MKKWFTTIVLTLCAASTSVQAHPNGTYALDILNPDGSITKTELEVEILQVGFCPQLKGFQRSMTFHGPQNLLKSYGLLSGIFVEKFENGIEVYREISQCRFIDGGAAYPVTHTQIGDTEVELFNGLLIEKI